MTSCGNDVVARARAGDRAAFGQLVGEHQAAVRGFLSRFVADADLADDLAQEVFVAAHRSLVGFRGEALFRSWLFGIARNLVALHFRQRPPERAAADDELERALTQWRRQRLEAEGEADETEQRLAALAGCIEALPGDSAELLTGYYFKGQGAAEVGRVTGKSVDAVRMALMRLRRALRRCVQAKLAGGTAA